MLKLDKCVDRDMALQPVLSFHGWQKHVDLLVYLHQFRSFCDWLVCGNTYKVRTSEIIHLWTSWIFDTSQWAAKAQVSQVIKFQLHFLSEGFVQYVKDV